MNLVSLVLSLHIIVIVGWFIYRRYYPQAVLLMAGMGMLVLATLMNRQPTSFSTIPSMVILPVVESFNKTLTGTGFSIMVIGGFVAYLKKIGAINALVYASLNPLSMFKRAPYLASVMVIPIGQLLFVSLPSATGLIILLGATIFPVLVNFGISRLSAASIILACTLFDLGPASANSAIAAQLTGTSAINYFLDHQLPVSIPLTVMLMVVYFFVNRFLDKRVIKKVSPSLQQEEQVVLNVPLIYAVLPVLPFVLLLIFTSFLENTPFLQNSIVVIAVFVSMFFAMAFEMIKTRKIKYTVSRLSEFWIGMGRMFATVVTLIVAADIFAMGLIQIGFVDALFQLIGGFGLAHWLIGVVLTLLFFMASFLSGSSIAIYSAFIPVVIGFFGHQSNIGIPLILSMQLACSIGRTVSPVSAVVVAASDITGVSPFELTARNLLPVLLVLFVSLFLL